MGSILGTFIFGVGFFVGASFIFTVIFVFYFYDVLHYIECFINRLIHKNMANVAKVTVTFDDGSVQEVTAAPVVAPTDTEVDVILSDGSTKVFVPKV